MVSLRDSSWQLEHARRLLIAAGALVVTAAAAGVAFFWWRAAARRPVPLEANWAAVVRTIAGNAAGRYADGPLAAAGFAEPFGIAVAPDGVIYVTDGGSHRVRRITVGGRVETLAGGVRGFRDGPATAAQFDTPSAIALDAAGVLYVADTGNHAVRRITPDGAVDHARRRWHRRATPTAPPHDSTGLSVLPSTAAAA